MSARPANERPTEAQAEREALRARILSAPDIVLDDPEIMRALLSCSSDGDRKIVDLRAAMVDRLETRMSRLRQAHRDAVEAAFDNMTGIEQTHAAALALLDVEGAKSLASRVRERLPLLMRVEEARLCLCLDDHVPNASATLQARREPSMLSRILGRLAHEPQRDLDAAREAERLSRDALDPSLVLLPREAILARGPAPRTRRQEEAIWERAFDGPARQPQPSVAIQFRDAEPADRMLFGQAVDGLAAVAVVALDLGPARSIGALAFGAADPERFRSGHAVELLSFLGGVVERLIRGQDQTAGKEAR